jgi:CubicO group peptidase (beta-lactamase class C family)
MRKHAVMAAAAVLAIGLAASCDARAALARKRIKAVEKGLLRAAYLKGLRPEPLDLRDRMAFYRVPAVSIAVVDGGRLEWAKAYGTKAAGAADPATPETLFQAGALGQAPAAAAVLRLVETGRLDLDLDIQRFLNLWRIRRSGPLARVPMTLGELLSHSAGFGAYEFPGVKRGQPLPSNYQVLDGEPPAVNPPVRLEFEPGTREVFSEPGLAVLEALLTEVWGGAFDEMILKPAGMTGSTYKTPLPDGLLSRAAAGHLRDGTMIEGGWLDYPLAIAKGLWTTPSELAVFGAAIMEAGGGKPSGLLSAAAARAMLTPRLGVYGLGLVVEGRTHDTMVVSLEGRTEGYSALLAMIPDKGQSAVVMTNGDNGEFLIGEVFRALSAAYGWAYFKPEEKPLYRLDPAVVAGYAGRYRLATGEILDVAAEDPCLVIRSSGRPPLKLYVDGETVFFAIDRPVRVRFERDRAGRAERLILAEGRTFSEATRIP